MSYRTNTVRLYPDRGGVPCPTSTSSLQPETCLLSKWRNFSAIWKAEAKAARGLRPRPEATDYAAGRRLFAAPEDQALAVGAVVGDSYLLDHLAVVGDSAEVAGIALRPRIDPHPRAFGLTGDREGLAWQQQPGWRFADIAQQHRLATKTYFTRPMKRITLQGSPSNRMVLLAGRVTCWASARFCRSASWPAI